MNAMAIAGDFFRNSYQIIEVATLPEHRNWGERIYQVMKRHIALLDPVASLGEYAFELESIKTWTIPFRIATIAQGIYLWQNDDNANGGLIGLDILQQLLNITRVAVSSLSPNFAFAMLMGDSLTKVHTLLTYRAAIVDRLKEMYDEGYSANLSKLTDTLLEGGNYVLRAAAAASVIALVYFRGTLLIHDMTKLPHSTINSIVRWCVFATGLMVFIGEAAQRIFNEMGLTPSPKRRALELTIATILSAGLTASLAVGLGKVQSLSEIFKPIATSVATLALGATLTYLFKKACSQFSDAFGIKPGDLREFEEWTFSVICALTITPIAATGLGLSKMISDSVLLMIQSAGIGFCGAFVGGAVVATSATLVMGAPSWTEIGYWLDIAAYRF